MRSNLVVPIVALFTLVTCTNTPKPLSYGSEGCHFCSMTIVDKQHAAQYMTKKGRTYSFDAIECMLNDIKEIDFEDIAITRVNDYRAPGKFIEAPKATYLISKNIPSPMGEFLSAFSSKEVADQFREKNQGKVLSWEELINKFKNKQIN